MEKKMLEWKPRRTAKPEDAITIRSTWLHFGVKLHILVKKRTVSRATINALGTSLYYPCSLESAFASCFVGYLVTVFLPCRGQSVSIYLPSCKNWMRWKKIFRSSELTSVLYLTALVEVFLQRTISSKQVRRAYGNIFHRLVSFLATTLTPPETSHSLPPDKSISSTKQNRLYA